MGQSPAERVAKIKKMKEEVCRQFASDNVTPDEVILRADHKIVIDRRRKFPWAKPLVVGEWR
jgi:hypothetical protein